jgi:spermidine/putrescine transport system substrate-binding protein
MIRCSLGEQTTAMNAPSRFNAERSLHTAGSAHTPTRRRFLQVSAAALSGIALSNCRRQLADVGAPSPGATATGGNTLNVYSWSGYFDDELLSNFTQQTGIRVVVDIFDSNETLLAKLQAGGGGAYSVIYPSDYMVQQMIELDMLSELDPSRLQGLDNLLPNFQNPVYDADNAHSVPATWGTTGLVYNAAQLNPVPQDWDYLWEASSALNRRMTLFNDVREVMGAVLKSLGYSYNSTDPAEIEAAYQRLVELKPAISSFTTDGWRDQLVTGDLVLAMGYSSDAIETMTESPDLQYLIPSSGSSLWTDTMAIPRNAPNPEAAYAWINFMLEPENAARAVERLNFATPNQAAIDLLSAEIKSNTNLFPPAAVLARCEGIAPVGEATELYDRYWTELTSA